MRAISTKIGFIRAKEVMKPTGDGRRVTGDNRRCMSSHIFDDIGVVQSLHQLNLGLNGTQRLIINGRQRKPLHRYKVARLYVESLVHDGESATSNFCAELLQESKMGWSCRGVRSRSCFTYVSVSVSV